MQILIVEDEKKLAYLIKRGFTEEKYSVDLAFDGEQAEEKFDINEYDLIILDILLPKIDGLSVLKYIRRKNINLPVIILTAKGLLEDRVTGLDAGADDYLVKPFSFVELTARIRAVLRRGNKADPPILKIDNLTLNPATRVVSRAGKIMKLTGREYSLLEYLLRNANHVLTKTQILEHVWDYNYEGFSNIVETYVRYLRAKLRVTPDSEELIHTYRGMGYILKKTD